MYVCEWSGSLIVTLFLGTQSWPIIASCDDRFSKSSLHNCSLNLSLVLLESGIKNQMSSICDSDTRLLWRNDGLSSGSIELSEKSDRNDFIALVLLCVDFED